MKITPEVRKEFRRMIDYSIRNDTPVILPNDWTCIVDNKLFNRYTIWLWYPEKEAKVRPDVPKCLRRRPDFSIYLDSKQDKALVDFDIRLKEKGHPDYDIWKNNMLSVIIKIIEDKIKSPYSNKTISEMN